MDLLLPPTPSPLRGRRTDWPAATAADPGRALRVASSILAVRGLAVFLTLVRTVFLLRRDFFVNLDSYARGVVDLAIFCIFLSIFSQFLVNLDSDARGVVNFAILDDQLPLLALRHNLDPKHMCCR